MASRDVRRLVKAMPSRMSQNRRPFRVCLGLFGDCLVSLGGPGVVSVTTSCDIMLKCLKSDWTQREFAFIYYILDDSGIFQSIS